MKARFEPHHSIFRAVVLCIFAWIVLFSASAQERKLQFRPYADYRKFHYGFFLGIHTQSLQVPSNGLINPETGEQWMASNDRFDPGFNVGLIAEFKLTDNVGLRILPTMYFGTKNLTFLERLNNKKEHQEVKSTYVSLPIHFKITPPRINNYRPYITTGLAPTLDLTVKDQEYIMVKPFNLFFEIGFGCDKYLPYFKFIPELKFSFGLLDILERDRSSLRDKNKLILTESTKSAHTNMISLVFNFE